MAFIAGVTNINSRSNYYRLLKPTWIGWLDAGNNLKTLMILDNGERFDSSKNPSKILIYAYRVKTSKLSS